MPTHGERRRWATLSRSEKARLVSAGLFDRSGRELSSLREDRVNDNRRGDLTWKATEKEMEDCDALLSESALESVVRQEGALDAIEATIRRDEGLERLRRVLDLLLDGLAESSDGEMRLRGDVIRIVLGEGNPPTMTELARRHGLGKSAVSLRCRKLLKQLGVEPSRFMRPEAEVRVMRASYRVREAIGIKPKKK